MQEHQVEIVGFQLFEGSVDRFLALLIAVMLHPDLSCEKNLLTGNTRFCDSCTNFFLVEIALCRVDQTIAHRKCIGHTPLALVLCHLIYAVAEHGHFDPVVELYIFHS